MDPTKSSKPIGIYDQIYKVVLNDGQVFVDCAPSHLKRGKRWVAQHFMEKWSCLVEAASLYHQYPSLIQRLSASMDESHDLPPIRSGEIVDVATNQSDLKRRFKRYYHAESDVIPNNLWDLCESKDDDCGSYEDDKDFIPYDVDESYDDGDMSSECLYPYQDIHLPNLQEDSIESEIVKQVEAFIQKKNQDKEHAKEKDGDQSPVPDAPLASSP